jgi:hypothetical protein
MTATGWVELGVISTGDLAADMLFLRQVRGRIAGRDEVRARFPDAVRCMQCCDPIVFEQLAPHDPGRWLHLSHHSWQGWPHQADAGPHEVGHVPPALHADDLSSWWVRTSTGVRLDVGVGLGFIEVRAARGGHVWRCVPAGAEPTTWRGMAPTPAAAMADAQLHAGRCRYLSPGWGRTIDPVDDTDWTTYRLKAVRGAGWVQAVDRRGPIITADWREARQWDDRSDADVAVQMIAATPGKVPCVVLAGPETPAYSHGRDTTSAIPPWPGDPFPRAAQ